MEEWRIAQAGGVAMLTINRPARRKAAAREETPELAALFDDSFAGVGFHAGFAALFEKRPPRFTAP